MIRIASLDSALATRGGVQPGKCLVMDVQGAELKVLQCPSQTLIQLKYILAEAADFNSYDGGCTLQELVRFLLPLGFLIERRTVFAKHWVRGFHCNVLFVRRVSTDT